MQLVSKTSRMGNSTRDWHVPHSNLQRGSLELVDPVAQGVEQEGKSERKTIFRSDITVENLGLPKFSLCSRYSIESQPK